MPMINIENLKYKYPDTDRLALDGISFSVAPGEFIGIVGPNGAGKSTLCQAMVGLVPQFYHGAYGGTVRVADCLADQVPVQNLCEKAGLIFQNPFNQLSGARDTVYGEVAYGLQNLGIEREEMKNRIEKVLRQLDIWQYRDRNPFDLSGGQMQRVAIASILVMEPEVVILDEPTSQLDPEGTEEVFRVVDDLARTGRTIIMVEQKLEKMAKYCDKLVLMQKGKVVAFDTPEKIFAREDLEEIGMEPPVFVKICKMCGLTNPDGTYPVTLEATVRLFEQQERQMKPDISFKGSRNPYISAEKSGKVFQMSEVSFAYGKKVPVFENLNLLLDHRITAIIGQNGAGKTTLGKAFARKLNVPFIDLDWYIEERFHKTVGELFTERGEAGFRELERNMLHEVAEFENVVISTGGGAPCFYDNMEFMNRTGKTVFLNVHPDVLFRRLRIAKQQRPILQGKEDDELMDFIIQALEKRAPFYTQAQYIFNADELEDRWQIESSVQRLQELLEL